VIRRRPPRARPLALGALALVAGLVLGLRGADLILPPVTFLAIAAGLAAVLLDRRGLLITSALLSISVGGVAIGLSAEARAARDCRASWRSGERVSLELAVGGTRVADGHRDWLPTGGRAGQRARPADRAGGA
jgi:hypothetical protein